jgi:hypothetical protein
MNSELKAIRERVATFNGGYPGKPTDYTNDVNALLAALFSSEGLVRELATELDVIVKRGGGHGSVFYDARAEYDARERALELLNRPEVRRILEGK